MERAREFLKKAGYGQPPADSAFRFAADWGFLRYLRDRDQSSRRWDDLEAGAVAFWYRQSPRPLVSSRSSRWLWRHAQIPRWRYRAKR